MIKTLLLALSIGICSATYSQTDYGYIYDTDAFISEGIRLYREKNYDGAVKEYDKVVANDPRYPAAQYEKALALSTGEKITEARAIYENAFSSGMMAEVPDFYMAYGSFLSDRKEYDLSEKMFKEAEKLSPDYSVLLYNMALLYVRKEERQKGIELLKKSISLNPNHPGSHYLLGIIALEDGRVTEGSMALLAYLTLVPESTVNESIILKLNSKFSENYLTKGNLVFSKEGDNFEDIDVILRNSLPLKSAYKINSVFDDVIIRQMQAIVDYAAEHKVQNGFFERMYIPWLADVAKRKQFEGFSYHILYSIGEKLGKQYSSQSKKLDGYVNGYLANNFWDVFAKRTVDLFGKQEEVVVYLKDGSPYYGKTVNGKKEGKYKILNNKSNIASELNFEADELEGLQKYYDYKGTLIEEKQFSKGKLNGKRTVYFSNGNPELTENYKNDMLDGAAASYYRNGGKQCEGSFVNNLHDGLHSCFYENGSKQSTATYSKDKLNGKYTYYDVAGNITEEQLFVNGEREGKLIQYYDGKTKKTETEYASGKIKKDYKTYFPDGKPKEETVYEKELPVKSVYFYPNGKKSYEAVFDKSGDPTSYLYYNDNTELYYQENYKQGDIKSGVQFGANIAKPIDLQVNKGVYAIKDFNGNILSSGKFEKGKKTGEWNYFYATGATRSKEDYANGLQVGKSYSYDKASRIEVIANYSKDSLNGVYESYEGNKLQRNFFYSGGKANGPSKTFYSDGKVSTESFYIDGNLFSKQISYWQNGKVNQIIEYFNDFPVKLQTFNPEGKKENEFDYKNNSGKIKHIYNNGNEVHEFTVANGLYDGKYTVKDKLGNLITDCNYTNAVRTGKYTKFGPTGAPQLEHNYYSGVVNGVSAYYDLVGNLRMHDTYIFGDNTGLATRYYSNKSKFSEGTRVQEEYEGEVKYFNTKGDNILILGYQNGELKYYTALDKSGAVTLKTPVSAQTAKIVSVYSNGNTAMEMNFVKGNYHGAFVIYNNAGQREYEAGYDMGLLTGTRIEYHPNGKIYKKENFKDSEFQGVQEYYKEDGKLWLTAEYSNDELHGLCKIYKDGTLSQTKKYDSNELVEILK